MNLKLLTVSVAILALIACGNQTEEASQPALDSVEQRLSYMVGNNIAKQFKQDGIELDIAILTLGIEDEQQNTESRLTQAQIQETITAIQQRSQQRRQEMTDQQAKARSETAEKNKTEGEAYLTANKTKEGVVTTESGLQYKELVAGDGSKPQSNDVVSVHYRGTLIDGTEFDSSYSRNKPATFPVTGVIPGWVEALQLMNIGDKWELTIPSDLAYGPGGTGGTIGPNATLVFEVELLDIVKPEDQ